MCHRQSKKNYDARLVTGVPLHNRICIVKEKKKTSLPTSKSRRNLLAPPPFFGVSCIYMLMSFVFLSFYVVAQKF